jgi:hypothetical protein
MFDYVIPYDPDFQASIGGYPKDTVVESFNGLIL